MLNLKSLEINPADEETNPYAVIGEDDSPCKDCEFRQKCGDEELACSIFRAYVHSEYVSLNARKTPNKFIYDVMFSGKD